jgi:hypothetical protein
MRASAASLGRTSTPRGCHLYFRAPAGLQLRNTPVDPVAALGSDRRSTRRPGRSRSVRGCRRATRAGTGVLRN